MTDDDDRRGYAQEGFEMALLERLHETDFWVLKDEKGEIIPREPETMDTELIAKIAEYLMVEEELGSTFESSEGQSILDMGVFIYGFMQWGKQLGAEADQG